MRASQLVRLLALGLLPIESLATATEPPTKTITEIHTVTYKPEDENNHVITQTVYQTVGEPGNQEKYLALSNDDQEGKQKQSGPELNGNIEEFGENGNEDEDYEIAEFGYDADYFQRRIDGDLEPEVEDKLTFQELNQENDEYDGFDGYDVDKDEEEDNEGGEPFDAASPYHLVPGYKGSENAKELEKPRPADQSKSTDKPNPSLDQNEPVEDERPNPDSHDAQTKIGDEHHSNFSSPENNEEGHPIPQPISEDYPEEEDEEKEEDDNENDDDGKDISKGKQVLDTEETASLLVGNRTLSGTRKGSNTSSQNGIPSFLGRIDKAANETSEETSELTSEETQQSGRRKPFKSIISRFDSSAASNGLKPYFAVFVIGGVAALFVLL